MIVLVDYDNIDKPKRERGVVYVVDLILASLGQAALRNLINIRFKLYGGWYKGTSITNYASRLNNEVSASFPKKMVVTGKESATVIVRVDLGYCLELEPSTPLFNTYIEHSCPRDLKARHPIVDVGCQKENCSLISTMDLINNKKCPLEECIITPKDFIYRGEQKLVDNMITVDAIYLSHVGEEQIGIVTSDIDAWPGIKTAMYFGAKIFHVCVSDNPIFPKLDKKSSNYIRSDLGG